MNTTNITRRTALVLGAIVAALAAGCASMQPSMTGQSALLYGSNEVPSVTTSAEGSGNIDVRADGTVTATVTVWGMTPTAAHIHEGATGTNGPVIVAFTKYTEISFVAPAGAKLTPAQYASYKAGNLYVNVHSAKNPGGEIRAQLVGK